MKKVILLSTLLVALFGYSQEREKGSVELTPLLGYGSANYYASEALSNKSLGGLNFGADLDYFFNNRWSLRSGVLIQGMGSKYGITNYDFKDKLTYLTIPVNANWHFGGTRKWNLNFGPSFGFLMKAETDLGPVSIDSKEFFNNFQLGLNYGIGYKIEVSEKFSILLDYQGMTGLTESLKDTGLGVKNAYGAFNVGGVIKL